MSKEPPLPGSAGQSLVPVSPYDVGYAKPPVQHRFQKGQSGNSRGRPKRASPPPAKLDPAAKPTDHLILAEAYRTVTIREGENTIELPAIQAAMRALAIAAMKGSRLSQKALTDIVREVEARKGIEHLTVLENAFEYKQKWTAELERRRKLGIDEPDPVPHPEEIIIDMRSGHVRTKGPLDETEKLKSDEALARRAEAQREVNSYAERYRRTRSAERKEWLLEDWHFEQRIFDLINESLPKRHQVKLENRSYASGASQEGKALEELRKNKALRREYTE